MLASLRDYAIGKIPHASTAIAALSGDVVSLLNSTIELGIKAGITATGNATLLRVFSRASGVAGVALLAGDVLSTLWKAFSTPDSAPDTISVVDLNGNSKGEVSDPELERLAHRFYVPEGTSTPGDDQLDSLADIVHKPEGSSRSSTSPSARPSPWSGR